MDVKRNQTKKKNVGLLLAGVGLSLGVCSGALFDGINIYHKNKSDGLVLLKDGAHLKQGTHKVVITDQFYELLTFETKEFSQNFAMSGLKTAYDRLNEVNTGIQFELCTTSPKVAEKYSLKQVENIDYKNDIPLYLTAQIIDGNKEHLAKATVDNTLISREMKNNSITFKKDAIFSVWDYFENPEQTHNPKNSCFYTLAMHETLHTMGFAHQKDKHSILYPNANYENRELSKEDIEMIQKYNYVYYGTSKNIQNQTQQYESAEEVEEMVF